LIHQKYKKIVEKSNKPTAKETPIHVPSTDLSDLKKNTQQKVETKNTKILKSFQENKKKIEVDDDLFGDVKDKPKKDTKIGDIDIDAYIAQNSNTQKGGLFD